MRTFDRLGIKSIAVLLACLAAVGVPVKACSWDYPIWQNRDKNADPYYRFIRDGKQGYIDRTGRIVVQPTIRISSSNSGDEFHNGLLLTRVAAGPYIDTTGKVALDTGYSRNWDFSDGLAAAMRTDEENRWGYIDRTGKFAIETKFGGYPLGYVYPFSNGRAIVKVGEKFGFIDRKGEFVIPPSYIWARGFSEDRARVIIDGPCARPGFEYPCDLGETLGKTTEGQKVSTCKFRLIDKWGNLLTEAGFDDARDFSEGLAAVQKDGKWGFIDTNGKVVIPFKFGSVENFSDGLAMVAEGGMWEDKKWGFIDVTGKIVIPFMFERAEGFSDGLAPVADKAYAESEKERYYYINKKGKRAFPETFALASPFFKGIGHVKLLTKSQDDNYYLNGKYAYIDTKGRVIFRYERKSDDD